MGQDIQPVSPIRSYQAVTEQVHERIRDGDWKVGERIPSERELAERFGVSRVVIREAMRHLEAMGIVEVRQGSGTYVQMATDQPLSQSVTLLLELQKASYVDLMTVRRVLELASARLAAARVTPRDAKRFQQSLSKMSRTAGKGLANLTTYVEYGRLDVELHRLVAQVARNQPLGALIDAILPMLMNARMEVARRYVDLEKFLARRTIGLMHEEHVELVNSILAQDPARAEATMDRHLARSLEFWANL
jgi:GntR family transcriptional repressor for pyruvate dehydrogenase complex